MCRWSRRVIPGKSDRGGLSLAGDFSRRRVSNDEHVSADQPPAVTSKCRGFLLDRIRIGVRSTSPRPVNLKSTGRTAAGDTLTPPKRSSTGRPTPLFSTAGHHRAARDESRRACAPDEDRTATFNNKRSYSSFYFGVRSRKCQFPLSISVRDRSTRSRSSIVIIV